MAHFFSNGTSYTRKKFLPPSTWEPPNVPEVVNSQLDCLAQDIENLDLKKPAPNLSKQERAAIVKLNRNKNIIIKPADKGSATMIMDTQHYIVEAEKQFANRQHYRPLDGPVFPTIVPKFNAILSQLQEKTLLAPAQVDYLAASMDAQPRRLYLLPKIHTPQKVDYTRENAPG